MIRRLLRAQRRDEAPDPGDLYDGVPVIVEAPDDLDDPGPACMTCNGRPAVGVLFHAPGGLGVVVGTVDYEAASSDEWAPVLHEARARCAGCLAFWTGQALGCGHTVVVLPL